MIWNCLNDPVLLEKLIQQRLGEELSPEDFSPSKLACLVLDQKPATSSLNDLFDILPNPLLQSAMRILTDPGILDAQPQNFTTASLVALALAYQFHITHQWNGLLEAIHENPSGQWKAPLAILFGLVAEPQTLLRSLVLQTASAQQFDLAIHTILCNPIQSQDQVRTLIELCEGLHGDPLPARNRIMLLRSLNEQRPHAAIQFCHEWLELHPMPARNINPIDYDPVENLKLLEESLFQVEVNDLVDNDHSLVELVKREKEMIQHVSTGLRLHYAEQAARHHAGRSIEQELLEIKSDLDRKSSQASLSGISTPYHARLALLLSELGLLEEASKLIIIPGSPLPEDPEVLFAIALVSEKSGKHEQACVAADRLLSQVTQNSLITPPRVFGDHYSLLNFGRLLLGMHKPNQASRVFELAAGLCPNDVNVLTLLADSYKDSRLYPEAAQAYHILVSLNPNDMQYRRSYARSLETIGDWEKALEERSIILSSSADLKATRSTEDIHSYANCALKANRPDLTINACETLLLHDPEDPMALIYTGKAFIQAGNSDKGLELLTRATQTAPNIVETWLALVEAQEVNHPALVIIETLQNASQAIPDSAEIHLALGEYYLSDNTPTLALPELKLAEKLSPDDPKILTSYGRSLSILGHDLESREILSKAFHIDPTEPGLAQLYAEILVDLDEYEAAIPPLEILISNKTSADPKPYMDYARCILTLHKRGITSHPPMNALIALNEVIQIEPDNAEARALIAETLAANGDKEIAFQAYREALDTCLIEDKSWLERLSYGFGLLASSMGKHDIAIAALQEAGQANPGNPLIFKKLSDAYLAANLPEDAIRTARNVLVIDGENPDNLSWFAYQVAELIQKEKADSANTQGFSPKTKLSEALNALNKAIQLAPTRTDLLVQLGKLQFTNGAVNEARVILSSIADFEFASIADLKEASEYLSGIGDHEAAIACLENGVFQDQQTQVIHNASIYACLASEHVKNNDPTSAINTLERALVILPGESSLVSLKIDILLGLGQSIEALNCIETTISMSGNEKSNLELYFLASKINRAMGNLPAAVSYAQMGLNAVHPVTPADSFTSCTLQQRILLADIHRALLQPEKAFEILDKEEKVSLLDFANEEEYLDFLCLHTELALETRGQIRSDIQDIQPESSNPGFSRLMAITSRLMNKAGNYKQAEQLFHVANNNFINYEIRNNPVAWSASYRKYLTMVSLVEAALDLGIWDQAVNYAERILEFSAKEPLSCLIQLKTLVLEAEFYNLCALFEANQHKPSNDAISKDAHHRLMKYLDEIRSILESYKDKFVVEGHGLLDDLIIRWKARADIVFRAELDAYSNPIEILAASPYPCDAVALINHLHQIDLHSPVRDGITKIIKIARGYSRNPAVLLQVAIALHDDNPMDAMKSLQAVLEQNPYSRNPTIAFCNILLTKIAIKLGQLDVAQKAVEIAINIWQDEPAWHVLAAQIYQRVANTHTAIQHLTEATKLSPKNIAYYKELGEIYLKNSSSDPFMLKQANQTFQKAIELDDNDVDALILYASTQYLQSDLENSEQNARKALLLAPNRTDTYQLLSEIAIKRNDFQGAYEYANKAIQLSPKDTQSTIILARSLSALGRHGEALSKLDSLLPTAPDAKMLHLERVNIIRKLNGTRAALSELKSLVTTYAGDFDLLNTLAKVYVEMSEPENAVNTAQLAIEARADITPPNELANLHLLIGQVLRQEGQLDEAITHLNEAIQLAPDRLEPYLELGLVRKEQRDYQQALQIFERATSIDPDDPRALFQAGLALKESKDYKSSETMLRRAVSLAPRDPNIRRQLAAVVALNLVHNPRAGRN